MFGTGDPDRAPLRCAEPTAYAHTGPEAALAALTGLASGYPHRVDLSMQETVIAANIGATGRFFREGDRGRRKGANIGRTREIWPCQDGWVSFGIRGGKARVATWATVERLAAHAPSRSFWLTECTLPVESERSRAASAPRSHSARRSAPEKSSVFLASLSRSSASPPGSARAWRSWAPDAIAESRAAASSQRSGLSARAL